ncbi:tetratricopeptide repeat protein [Olivibacter domesticus]|uniref:Tetratricopeptide repeat-containing protein n=1 Tax=Olivibacter domesticus TaxID=407022 RepID=A0A1H7L9S4_OLID1|nr:tetratricopeptide repeat protein [Olivibacter domesticus]SEK95689.1 Tetratricopeptide repeat-containing protein [Olivibacter domesticus]
MIRYKLLLIAKVFCLLSITTSYCQDQKPNEKHLIVLYQSQKFGDAADYLAKFYNQDTADIKILEGLAFSNKMASNYVEAEKYYKKWLEKDRRSIGVLSNLASINFQRGDYREAKGYYLQILALDSAHLSSYRALSAIAQTNGELEVSHNYLSSANRINPKNIDIAYDLAVLNLSLKQYSSADSILSIALINDPKNILLLKAKAQALYGLQKFKSTIELGEILLEAGDSSDMVLNLLAPSYYFDKNYVKCKDLLNTLESRGELKEAQLYYMAMSNAKLQLTKQALNYFEKTLEAAISPNVANYYFEKATLHEKAGQYHYASRDYRNSLQFKVLPITFYSLGLLYDYKLKQVKTAKKYYQRYLRENPKGQENKLYIKFVKQRMLELGNKL